MRNIWKKLGVTAFTVWTAGAGACGTEDEVVTTTQAVVSPQQAGKGVWTDLGPITVRPPGTRANLALARVNPEAGPGDGDDGRRDTFIVDDLRGQRRYRVRYDWSAVLTPAQMTGPREDRSLDPADPGAEEIEASVAKGWSNGIDSRTRRDLAAFSSTFDPYESFGFVSSGCSGTMIRQTSNGTFAMTAAHCMYDNAGNPIATTVQPRRDGATLPYGTWNVTVIHRYDYWVNNACYFGNSQTDDCRRYDIVLLELAPQAGAVYPGGMTYGSYSESTIGSHTKYHRGYPGCGAVDSPAGCVGQTLYGDGTHLVSNFRRSDRLFDHSSDTNGGHSGGPMYFYDGDPKFYGVNSGSYCAGAACNSLYASISVRISSDWFDYVYDQLHN